MRMKTFTAWERMELISDRACWGFEGRTPCSSDLFSSWILSCVLADFGLTLSVTASIP